MILIILSAVFGIATAVTSLLAAFATNEAARATEEAIAELQADSRFTKAMVIAGL